MTSNGQKPPTGEGSNESKERTETHLMSEKLDTNNEPRISSEEKRAQCSQIKSQSDSFGHELLGSTSQNIVVSGQCQGSGITEATTTVGTNKDAATPNPTDNNALPESLKNEFYWYKTMEVLTEMLVEGSVHPSWAKTLEDCNAEIFNRYLGQTQKKIKKPKQ